MYNFHNNFNHCSEPRVRWTPSCKWAINEPIDPIAQVSPDKLGQSMTMRMTMPITLAMAMKWHPQQQLGHKSDIKFPATTLRSSKIFNDSHFLRPTLVDRKTSNCDGNTHTFPFEHRGRKKARADRLGHLAAELTMGPLCALNARIKQCVCVWTLVGGEPLPLWLVFYTQPTLFYGLESRGPG